MAPPWVLLPLLLLATSARGEQQQYPYACDSKVYCIPGEGSLLHTVQMALLYEDSKTFVDKPMKHSEAVVLANFRQMMSETGDKPSRERVQEFVDANFDKEGTEFTDWDPQDWKEEPEFLEDIKDKNYRDLAKELNSRWKDLGRRINPKLKGSDATSLIYLENPFIVPGGRFREMYYWDSYWTIIGLLKCEMTDTVKGMLENFAYLVDTANLIPNGNRIYYTRRSQPPLFIAMVDEYYRETKDKAFLLENIASMDREFKFWINNRTEVKRQGGKNYRVAVYNVEVDGPRPESYREDLRDAKHFQSEEDRLEFYMNIKSGAESGWDYSTKWFMDETGGESQNILDINTRRVVPVELNSYLCRNARVMKQFYEILGKADKQEEYEQYEKDFKESIETLLWSDELGSWFDYDLDHEVQRLQFYPSTVAPLWADCYPRSKVGAKVKQVLKYLESTRAMTYVGGVPTSMVESGQQWDFSNAWAPLQELLVTGLENAGTDEAKELAFNIAEKWIYQNWATYEGNDIMYEKYDVTKVGPGAGGEYDVQDGFGWTNGVYLDLISKYGDRVSSSTPPSSAAVVAGITTNRLMMAVLVVLFKGFLNSALFGQEC